MLFTSAEANKMLRTLRDELSLLQQEESRNCKFNCSVMENIEDVKPEYDFIDISKKMKMINNKIRKIKHAINIFNTTTEVIDDITIDEALIMLPQLNERKNTLHQMLVIPEKKRERAYGSNASIIDYVYSNFNHDTVRVEYDRISKMIDEIQINLDQINSTKVFQIAI